MDILHKFKMPPGQCVYLPDETWQLEYEIIGSLTREEYGARLKAGWRKFGFALFRPQCPACSACQPIRVVAAKFEPNRSQRRVIKANCDTKLVIGEPEVTSEKVDLYMRHHLHHAEQKGWPSPDRQDPVEHLFSFSDNPFPLQEWRYYQEDKLIGVSYIDVVPEGFSGVYFFFDPEYRDLSPGTWICISLIQEAARQGVPYVYLGYFIQTCRSMEYKAKFLPNQVLGPDGTWQDFLK